MDPTNQQNFNEPPQANYTNPNLTTDSNQEFSNQNEVKKSNFKIIKWLIILSIFILLIGVGAYFSLNNKEEIINILKSDKTSQISKSLNSNLSLIKDPSPSQSEEITNNTILYKNNYEPKISFSYPADNKWEVKDYYYNKPNISHIPGMISVIAVVDKECKDMCEEVFAFGIFERGSRADPGIDSKEKAMALDPSYILVSKRNLTLDSLNGTRLEYMRKGSENGNSIDYIFTNEKYAFYIGVNMNAGAIGRMNYQEIGDEIANSIKFSQ